MLSNASKISGLLIEFQGIFRTAMQLSIYNSFARQCNIFSYRTPPMPASELDYCDQNVQWILPSKD